MARTSTRGRTAAKQGVTRNVDPLAEENLESQEAPVAEEDLSQDVEDFVPEGVDPETGEITDAETGEPLEIPEGVSVAPGVAVTQEVVDAVAAEVREHPETQVDGVSIIVTGEDEDAAPAPEEETEDGKVVVGRLQSVGTTLLTVVADPENAEAAKAEFDKAQAGKEPPKSEEAPEERPEGEGEPAEAAAVEPEAEPDLSKMTAAQRRSYLKEQRKGRTQAVELPAEPPAEEPEPPVEPEPEEEPETETDAADPDVQEPEVKPAAKRGGPVKVPAKPKEPAAKPEPKKRVKKEKAVLEGGWPVDTGVRVTAQQRPAKTAMPTGRTNWFRAGETHFVWILDQAVHGTYWLDISFDRVRRTAEFWWYVEGKNAQHHYMEDVSSDEDALKELGFIRTFPREEDDVVLPEGIKDFSDLWKATKKKK